MATPNPYKPPNAPVSDVQAVPSKYPRYVVAGLVAVQMLGTLYYSGVYVELARRSVASPLALILGAPASACLYVAAILAVISHSRGRLLFLFGAIGLALSVPLWGWQYVWSLLPAFGAALGMVGWWITRRTNEAA